MQNKLPAGKSASILTFVSVLLFALFCHAQDFSRLENKMALLGHWRQDYPTLYMDFALRYDLLNFLDDSQQALVTLGRAPGSATLTEFRVYEMTSAGSRLVIDRQRLARDLQTLLQNQPNLANKSFGDLLTQLARSSLLYPGLNAALAGSSIPDIRTILRLPPLEKYIRLQAALSEMPNFQSLNPTQLGLEKGQSLSGGEVFNLYSEAVRATETSRALIILLSIFKSPLDFSKSLGQISFELRRSQVRSASLQIPINEDAVTARWIDELATSMRLPPWSPAAIKNWLRAASAESRKSYVQPQGIEKKLKLTLSEVHPYDAQLRGQVGDCASDMCPRVPWNGEEKVFFFKHENVDGYLQFTRVRIVMPNGEKESALYLHTISGANLSLNDAAFGIKLIYASLARFGATQLILPQRKKLTDLINFPGIENIYLDLLAENDQDVAIEYLDKEDRTLLAPFAFSTVDNPEKNLSGKLVQSIHSLDKYITKSPVVVESGETPNDLAKIFRQISRQEAFIIALDVKNRDENSKGLAELLDHYGIAPNLFEKIWSQLKNISGSDVQRFHESIQTTISHFDFEVDWRTFVLSPLFFRGHFAAADALATPQNKATAMGYINLYLTSYTDLDFFYNTLRPFYHQLVNLDPFNKSVRRLFKKNRSDFNRILDYYELEHKSAFHTLVKLFDTGMPREPFITEIAELQTALESKAGFLEDPSRADAVFLRRQALLARIFPDDPRYFHEIMARLDDIGKNKRTLTSDDSHSVINYFVHILNRAESPQTEIDQMQNFFETSRLGMEMIYQLGFYSIGRLNIPRLARILIHAKQYKAAAFLVHRDPWPKNAEAKEWLATFWQNHNEIGAELMLDAIEKTPSWLEVQGIDQVINGLIEEIKNNVLLERKMLTVLLKNPRRLNRKSLTWLSTIRNPILLGDLKESLHQSPSTWSPLAAKWLTLQLDKPLEKSNVAHPYVCSELFTRP